MGKRQLFNEYQLDHEEEQIPLKSEFSIYANGEISDERFESIEKAREEIKMHPEKYGMDAKVLKLISKGESESENLPENVNLKNLKFNVKRKKKDPQNDDAGVEDLNRAVLKEGAYSAEYFLESSPRR